MKGNENMASYLDNGKLQDCSGCGACKECCPKQCIVMEQGEDGFLFPRIDKTLCIHCNKCRIVCPFNHPVEKYTALKSFSGAATDLDICEKSSSGGLFYVIAKYILARHGVVAGAIFDKDYHCVHSIAYNEEELMPMLGSKYVQSDCSAVYPRIKDVLEAGREALFSGTPCQVAGLRNFLGNEYSNLYCIDVACHGVPSAVDFETCKTYLEDRYKGKLSYLKFRDKKRGGWYHSISYIIDKNGHKKEYTVAPYKVPYYYLFLGSMNIRKSCYNCQYVGLERTGDITLADFWRAEKIYREKEIGSGISAVLCNTEKGKELFLASVKSGGTRETELEKLIDGNQPFLNHIAENPNRDRLLRGIIKNGYRDTKKYIGMKKYIVAVLKASVPEKLKRLIFRYIGVK